MLQVNVVETMPFTRAIRKIAASLLPAASQLLLLMKRRSLRVLVIHSVPESLFSDNFSCFLNGLII